MISSCGCENRWEGEQLHKLHHKHKFNSEWPFLRDVPHLDHDDDLLQHIATPVYLHQTPLHALNLHSASQPQARDISGPKIRRAGMQPSASPSTGPTYGPERSSLSIPHTTSTQSTRGRYHRNCRHLECPFARRVWNRYAYTFEALHGRRLDLKEEQIEIASRPNGQYQAPLVGLSVPQGKSILGRTRQSISGSPDSG